MKSFDAILELNVHENLEHKFQCQHCPRVFVKEEECEDHQIDHGVSTSQEGVKEGLEDGEHDESLEEVMDW